MAKRTPAEIDKILAHYDNPKMYWPDGLTEKDKQYAKDSIRAYLEKKS